MAENITSEKIKINIPKSMIRIADFPKPRNAVGNICDMHYHDELELLPVYHGELIAIVDGIEHAAHGGDVLFINSRVPHMTLTRTLGTVSGLLQFKENDFISREITKIIKYSARFKTLSNDSVSVIHSQELISYIDEIIKESAERQKAYEVYIRAGICKILGFLYRNNFLSDPEEMYNQKEVQRILPVISYINEYYSENVTLEEMSDMLGFDKSYFCRIFKSATGATFTEYLNFVRICRAEKLLSNSKSSILDISETVGFSSLSYFNRIFKKYKNCSPRDYRSATYANI